MIFWKKSLFLSLIFLFLSVSSSDAAKILGMGSKEYDVVFIGEPMTAKIMRPGEPVDALDDFKFDGVERTVIVFEIKRVLIGQFSQVPFGGMSRRDQMQEAAKERKILKILTADFTDPGRMMDRQTLKIGVKNPGETFGITVGEDLSRVPHKIYLKRIAKNPEAFQFIKSHPANQDN